MPEFSGRTLANGKTYGGWKNSANTSFNEYVDIIEEFNKYEEHVEAYNMALKKSNKELKATKSGKRKKCNFGMEQINDTTHKFSLPPSMIIKDV